VSRRIVIALGATVALACSPQSRGASPGNVPDHLGLGRPAAAAEIAAVDIEVGPDGAGLPAGSGTPEQGASVYLMNCATCHGNNGEGKPPLYPQLLGGPRGNFDFASDAKIPRTIGNYWPYATTVFDYVRRAMPLTAPRSLTDSQYYAVTAYLLQREGIIAPGTVMDAKSLPAVQMPGRSHFVVDDRTGNPGGKSVR
jgi:S-disulfanyl-L-cysteine oxidoreductase SoxD